MGAAQEALLGRVVGSYRLVRKIGEGGMGAVYEAEHVRIGKRAAVKVLHAELARRPEFAARFFNEASAIHVVRHPGIVNIFEYGSDDDGTLYLIMEYLEGETLGARLQRAGGKIPADALRLSRQIASTLAAAHEHGIVHRDLKPDNVMVVADPETPGGERAKILDFGIAKLVQDSASSHAQRPSTDTGATIGTPVYMSPEQCRSSSRVGPKTDVYALGVMLYEMLVGQPPFVGEGTGHVIAMHIYVPPPPIQSIDPSVPEALAELVHRLLEKEPAARPTMHHTALALEELGAPRSTSLVIEQGAPRAAAPPGSPLHSTLRGAAAERLTRDARPGALLRASGIALGATAALGAALLRLGAGDRPEPPPRPVIVHWSIESDPPGAEVVRLTDREVVGRTPLSEEHRPIEGTLAVKLRKEGYEERTINLDLSANTVISERLIPKPAPAAPATPTDARGHHPTRAHAQPDARRGAATARPAAPGQHAAAGAAEEPEAVEDLGKLKAPRGPR